MYSIVLLNDYRASGLYGFISGHTAGAFGFAVWSLLLQRNACYTAVILLWAFLMGWSRIYLGAHFISDVVGGIIAGSLLGWAVYAVYRKVLKYIFTLKQ
jgi:undecaprenyl-diphosphatase